MNRFNKLVLIALATFLAFGFLMLGGCEVSHSSCFSTQKHFVGYGPGWMPHHAPKPVKRKSY